MGGLRDIIEFNRVANAISDTIADHLIAAAEATDSEVMDERAIFYAASTGAITAAVRLLDATHKAHPFKDLDEMFDGLMRQMVDIWGQVRGQPHQTGGTVQ